MIINFKIWKIKSVKYNYFNQPGVPTTITFTEQQTTARNPRPVQMLSEWNFTVILVPLKGSGMRVPQYLLEGNITDDWDNAVAVKDDPPLYMDPPLIST